ncbi:MAG: 4Fe-4S dicluster domain-containing protein [Armatimonadetes bacterium]|nr:4Fe-4S dicluster domain-containing protein [Armatimonadota bacterium]
MKRIYAKEDYCIGCRLCEIYCIFQHSGCDTLVKAFSQKDCLPDPAVRVEEDGAISFALQCRHCDDAPCVAACISGAMTRDPETGAIKHDPDKCIGCWSCVMVCPFGAIQINLEKGKVSSKCDLCGGDVMPACVAHCPNEALVYE